MKVTDTQADLLSWLYSPGERYVHWKERQGRTWGASLVDRSSTYPRRPRVTVGTALALLRRGLIRESHRDENGPFCEITESGRAAYVAKGGVRK